MVLPLKHLIAQMHYKLFRTPIFRERLIANRGNAYREKNYCTPVPTIANFNPIQIYDKDDANITPSAFIKCWPDNVFTYTNTTNRNCVPQGNTFQRQERWNLGDHWGLGHDSIVGWRPWPPTSPLTVAYPSVGTYTVLLQDSNLCGVDVQVQSVSIVNPPTAGLIAPPGPFLPRQRYYIY